MRRRARPGGGRQVELTVTGLGGRGDGVASHAGRPVFVPGTMPGDRVLARLTGERAGGFKGEVLELLESGPERAEPPCPYFGRCGGCAVQHVREDAYLAWKQGLVGQALARRGLAGVPVRPMVRVPPGSRRRATLAATARGGEVALGLHAVASHAVVDLESCLVLTPRLLAILPHLRIGLAPLLQADEIADVTLTETEEGPDVLVVSRAAPDLAAREALAACAEAADLARLSWAAPARAGDALTPEPVSMLRPPRLRFGEVWVEPSPGAFVQPTASGERALVETVMRHAAGAERIADLYAGCGTFTFPLSARAKRVHAVEGDGAALAALAAAANRAGLAGRVTAEARDLARAPLEAAELAGFDAVVFDPPRAGAREQAAALAASRVPVAVAVSCHPNSFARDARLLVDGGFDLVEVVPVDQFPWSSHLELVALFRR